MRVGIYLWAAFPVAEVCAGFGALGHDVVQRRPLFNGSSDCEAFDLVIVAGWRGACATARECYARRGVPVIVIDAPWFGPYGAGTWRLSGGDSPGWLFPEGAPATRAVKLGSLPRFTAKKPAADAPVLICGQVPGDAAHQLPSDAAIRAWAEETLAAVRAQVDRPMIWRPHPSADARNFGDFDHYSDPADPIDTEITGAYAVVTVSSGCGLDALAQGVPVIATGFPAYGGLAHEVRGLPKIEPPDLDAVQSLFARLAYQHWAPEEVAVGKGLDLFARLALGESIAWPKKAAPAAKKPARAKGTRRGVRRD